VAPVISIREVRRQVERFDPRSDREAARGRRRTLRLLLEQQRDALDRRNYEPGHVTASGIVLSPDRSAILIVYHRRLGRWLQPGGHLDRKDKGTMEAAAREVLEETGVELRHERAVSLVGINVHRIPPAKGEPEHLHHDLVWRFIATGARLWRPTERRQAVWCPVDSLHDHGADEPLLRTVRRALRH
jgi:8-oxo-dGTP pyrophosphatase MutT (NUDIX family)